MNPPIKHVRCVMYALRTIVRVLPALGRSSDHLHPPVGLSFKHFAIAGVISGVTLVAALLALVALVVRVAMS
jgi:hypothetical protein